MIVSGRIMVLMFKMFSNTRLLIYQCIYNIFLSFNKICLKFIYYVCLSTEYSNLYTPCFSEDLNSQATGIQLSHRVLTDPGFIVQNFQNELTNKKLSFILKKKCSNPQSVEYFTGCTGQGDTFFFLILKGQYTESYVVRITNVDSMKRRQAWTFP